MDLALYVRSHSACPRACAWLGSGPAGEARERSSAAIGRPPIPHAGGRPWPSPSAIGLTPSKSSQGATRHVGAPGACFASLDGLRPRSVAEGRSPRGVDCVHVGFSGLWGASAVFTFAFSFDGSRPGQRGKGSASPTSSPGPSAALRAAACGRALAPLARPSPLVTRRR